MSNRKTSHTRTLKAIIFDLDGTIAETEDAHRAAFNRAFAAAGLDWSWDPHTWSGLLEIAGGRNRLHAWLADNRPELLQGPQATHLLDTLHGAKDRLYREILEAGEIPLRPGIRALIDEARADGVKIAIATTSRRAIARRVIECCLGEGALAWFDAFLGHEDATYRKPHPDIYRRAAARLRLRPRDCLALEDSAIGVASAVAAGVPVVATVNAYSGDRPFEGALAVLSDLGAEAAPFRRMAGPAEPAQTPARAGLALLSAWHEAAVAPGRDGSADRRRRAADGARRLSDNLLATSFRP
ncbi:HAD-IA family hydrolase [Caenispirillum salinarum]|uniref:HAD-IA family hydrolase n=1 Tax=Caenispirillum salinarum TaxID=859058 RepID=UPI00384C6DB2